MQLATWEPSLLRMYRHVHVDTKGGFQQKPRLLGWESHLLPLSRGVNFEKEGWGGFEKKTKLQGWEPNILPLVLDMYISIPGGDCAK